MFRKDARGIWRSTSIDSLGWLDHGFGGRWAGQWLEGERVATLRQIHSDRVVLADEREGKIGDGDALMATQPGLWIAMRTADCVPVVIADPARCAVAIVHSGWRGTATSIAIRAVESLEREFGSQRKHLITAIGPGIGACCYEVGAEVASRLKRWWPERQDLDSRTRVDLGATILRQLTQAGIEVEHVDLFTGCTCCQPEEFESFRRDGERSGRMVSAVSVRAGGLTS